MLQIELDLKFSDNKITNEQVLWSKVDLLESSHNKVRKGAFKRINLLKDEISILREEISILKKKLGIPQKYPGEGFLKFNE